MNDFTKEELQIIHLDMNAYIHRNTILAESPSHRALRDKVELMIDNYRDPNCSHEVDRTERKCKLCGLPSHNIPCVGGWI